MKSIKRLIPLLFFAADRVPFTLRFMTDEFEHETEGLTPQKGFKVSFFQTSAGC